MGAPKTVGLCDMTPEQVRDYRRQYMRQYREDGGNAHYSDEELIRIRREIWTEVFAEMAVELGAVMPVPTTPELLRTLIERLGNL